MVSCNVLSANQVSTPPPPQPGVSKKEQCLTYATWITAYLSFSLLASVTYHCPAFFSGNFETHRLPQSLLSLHLANWVSCIECLNGTSIACLPQFPTLGPCSPHKLKDLVSKNKMHTVANSVFYWKIIHSSHKGSRRFWAFFFLHNDASPPPQQLCVGELHSQNYWAKKVQDAIEWWCIILKYRLTWFRYNKPDHILGHNGQKSTCCS